MMHKDHPGRRKQRRGQGGARLPSLLAATTRADAIPRARLVGGIVLRGLPTKERVQVTGQLDA
eukprot:814530-Lingulodinium_polyedra.AAC.1